MQIMKDKRNRGLYMPPQAELWVIPSRPSILTSMSVRSDIDSSIGAIEGEEDFV